MTSNENSELKAEIERLKLLQEVIKERKNLEQQLAREERLEQDKLLKMHKEQIKRQEQIKQQVQTKEAQEKFWGNDWGWWNVLLFLVILCLMLVNK